ncbi:MAG: hypothetical protein ACK2UA_13350 [Anaerolineae bacterium]
MYALSNIATYLPKVETEEANFRAYTGWYVSTVLRSCIIAMVVLWLLTTLNLEVGSGLGVDFKKMPPIVLTGTAFILGFYGRVARAQLDEIVRFLFRRAWLLAKERFGVVPQAGKVVFGKQQQFKVDPPADVTWSAGMGTIDAAGLYTAPPRSDAAGPGTRVLIRASLQGEPSISSVATVTLVPFKLIAEKSEMVYGESQQLSVDSMPPEGVELSTEHGTLSDFRYEAPSEDEGITEVTITATRKPRAIDGDEAEKAKEEEAAKQDCDSITIRLKKAR